MILTRVDRIIVWLKRLRHVVLCNMALTQDQKAENRYLSQERLVIEHIIRSLKIFRLLLERYRNRRKCFGLRFNLIATLYNHGLDD
jgi:hypothetical protein